MTGISREQLFELERAVHVDPGAACFPALAEVHRRAGRLTESEEVARQGLDHKPDASEGRLVLALVLLDQGRTAEARDELGRLSEGVLAARGIGSQTARASAPDHGPSESEIERAFSEAETDTDELIDPNRVAEAAVAHVDAAAEEGLDEDLPLDPGSDFATATMARLLEAQGDERGARRIREALRPESPAPDPGARNEHRREQVIGTLERWLANLRGERP